MKQPAAVDNMRGYKCRQSLTKNEKKKKNAKSSNELQPHTLKSNTKVSTYGLVQAEREPDKHPQIVST